MLLKRRRETHVPSQRTERQEWDTLILMLSCESSDGAPGLFLEGAALPYLRRGQPGVRSPEVVWRLTHVSPSLLQLLDETESHYSCQLLFLLSAPVVLIRRAAALRRQNKKLTAAAPASVSAP